MDDLAETIREYKNTCVRQTSVYWVVNFLKWKVDGLVGKGNISAFQPRSPSVLQMIHFSFDVGAHYP
jgi:hypothetical protein